LNLLSWQFALFTLLVLLGARLLPPKARNFGLLTASLFFYTTFAWQFTAILLVSTVLNYLLGLWIGSRRRGSSFALWLGVGLNLMALFVFRAVDGGYTRPILQQLLQGGAESNLFRLLVLPVGFSFFTLQAVSYLVDVSHQRLSACEKLIDFALYMAWFPKLVSGPIERAQTFLPKLAPEHAASGDMIARGFTQLIVGLVRKIVIADVLYSFLPDKMFLSADPALPRLEILVIYGVYLYNDFAGYTGIARGISSFFGIELSSNFRQPYLARSFTDFWTRWHISLSFWLRDYIYFPLMRNLLKRSKRRVNALNFVLPPLVTMLASGLWHDLSPALIMWGALHGLYQILERLLFLRWPEPPTEKFSPLRKSVSILVIFSLAMFAWVPFGARALRPALAYLQGLFAGGQIPLVPLPFWILSAGMVLFGLLWSKKGSRLASAAPILFFILVVVLAVSQGAWPAVIVLFSFGLDLVLEKGKDEAAFLRLPQLAQASLLTAAIILIIVAVFWNIGYAVQVFVYQGF